MTSVDRSASNAAHAPRALVLAAFAAIYLIWGSTYLAIKYAVETVPPFFMTGARFLVAGSVLYAWSVLRARRGGPDAEPRQPVQVTRRRWRDAFIVGALLIVGGTALVGWAELSVPSGITSLILATTPLWMVVMESAIESKRAPTPRVITGVVVGIVGLAVLVGPSLFADDGDLNLLGVASLALAALAWSAGAMTEPENALTKQYAALVEAEGASLSFTTDGIAEIARIATIVNGRMENIGARRLHTVMTTLLEDVMYDLPDRGTGAINVDRQVVNDRLRAVMEDEDLRRYIL